MTDLRVGHFYYRKRSGEVIPKINSAHGSDTRNIINRAIEVLNQQGIYIQDIVAEGQLTPSQYAELITVINGLIKSGHVDKSDLTSEFKDEIEGISTQLAQNTAYKMDKNTLNISPAQINKSLGKFDETYMSESFLQQMTGNAPVNATPANQSLTSVKYVDNSLFPQHADFVSLSSNLYDESKNTLNTIILSDGTVSGDNGAYHLSEFILVNPNTVYFSVGCPSMAEYDADRNFIRRFDVERSGGSFTTSTNTYYIRMNMQFTSTYYVEGRLNLGVDQGYEPYRATFKGVKADENTIEDNSVSEKKVKNNAITSAKRTSLGELPLITIGQSGGIINLDTITRKVVFEGTAFVFHRNNRYTIESGTELDFSTFLVSGIAIYFDTVTQSCYLKSQNNLYEITETSILLGVFYQSGGVWDLRINANYVINGKPKYMPYDETSDIALPYQFSVEKLNGDFPESNLAGVGETGNPFNRTNDDYNLVYSLFDGLMNDNPNYITREQIGLSTNSVPIYCYHFKPDIAPITAGPLLKPYPKVLMDSSVHGGENLGTDTLYFLFKRICEDWQTDKGLEYLRHYVNFSIVPLPNPEDYTNKQYIGLNGVNLNRDFDFDWQQSEGAGTTAFSRVESQVMRDFFFANDDALLFVNCHVRGNAVKSDNEIMWLGSSDVKETPILSNTIEKMTRKWKQKYPSLQNVDGQLGYITTRDGSGTIKSYAHRVVGIPSILWEGFKASPTMNEFEGKDVVDMNVQFLGETVFNIIKSKQD